MGSASKRVEVCGPAKTGALTMGFWQNKNGQGIITSGASAAGVCNSGAWLRQFTPEGTHVYTDEYDSYATIERAHTRVCHAAGEWARDADGDSTREAHTKSGCVVCARHMMRCLYS